MKTPGEYFEKHLKNGYTAKVQKNGICCFKVPEKRNEAGLNIQRKGAVKHSAM